MSIDNRMAPLLALQKLTAARSGTDTANGATGDSASFKDAFAKMQKEQKEWDALMDQVDLAQYKLAIADSFWSDSADPWKYLRRFAERRQQSLMQASLGTLVESVTRLRALQALGLMSAASKPDAGCGDETASG